ncbi:hypothetical protein [Thermomonospora umbrina]|uniref:hypothetical protein n=1 Tax=Thermomonospora umbrina TaxID=111806 RepID=UPI0011C122C2|nr:hypothetical protein [Thermomonospora umbrina]
MANVALAALWAFSALGGWGAEAFCGEGGNRDAGCGAAFDTAVLASLGAALPAAVTVVCAWALPGVRRDARRLDWVLALAAFMWLAAEGILVVGGYVAQP